MNKKGFFFICILVFIISSWSCTSDKRIDKDAVQQELKDREIKRVTEAEIVSKVHELGNSIALNAKKTLGKNLKEAIQNGGVENAISFCNTAAMPLVDSLNKALGADIRRVSSEARNPNDLPNDLEKKLLEAYKFQWKDSIPQNTNVQAISDDQYLFTKPIMIDNALCLTCHGTLGNGLTQDTDEFIKSKYPLDRATGYKLGDLRGMWSITISKKKVVQSM